MNGDMEANGNPELSAVVGALLDTLDDKNEVVKQSVIESIQRISRQNPNVVIHAAIYFSELHKKISVQHMASLLRVMSDTCRHKELTLDTDLASSVAELGVIELLGCNGNEAMELLVALSRIYCTQAMGELLTKLEPGILPHHMTVQTIGLIAECNPDGMLCFLKIALTIMLPMLTETRDDHLKRAFCFTIGKFFETISHYLMNTTEGSQAEINRDTYREEIRSAFNILMCNWLKPSRDNSVAEAVLIALISIIPLLPEEIENERIVRLVPVLLSFCKKTGTRLAATRALAVLLSCAGDKDKEVLRPFLEQIHHTLSELIVLSPLEASRDIALTHYEALQCSQSVVTLYPEEGLDRVLQQLKSPLAAQRSRALMVLRHLINTLPPEDDATIHRIALNLQDSLAEIGARQMVGAIVALAARPSLPLLPSQQATFVRYMVSHCNGNSPENEACSEALYLLATTVDGAETWLWPSLLHGLLDPIYVRSAAAILRALSPLASKIIRNENSPLQRDFPGTNVLTRCLELLTDTQIRLAVIIFLKSTAPLFGHGLKPCWDEKLLELIHFLQDELNGSIDVDSQRSLSWEEKMVEFLELSVKIEGDSWGMKLAEKLAVKTNMMGIAPLMASICCNNSHITLLIELVRSHGACQEYARAVGICAKRHLPIVLKLMEEFCYAEDMRKTPARLLGLIKDTKAAATAEIAKAGLLRAYGEIAQKGDSEKLYSSYEKHIAPWIIRQLNDCKEATTKEAGLFALEQVAKAVHPDRLCASTGLRAKGTALATLLGMLQSVSGYRPLHLYSNILRAAISLIRSPQPLTPDEREIFLSTVLDKVTSASSELVLLLQPNITQQLVDELGTLCSEVVGDSPETLAVFVDILLPWMQSKTSAERKTTILVLRTTLTSYYNSIKYTFPGGKLVPGKFVGRVLSWCSDSEPELRPLVIDCVGLSLNIAERHRSLPVEHSFDETLQNAKIMINDKPNNLYDGIKYLATAVSNRIPNGEIIPYTEGLIEGLLYRGEASNTAAVGLTQHFNIKGPEISRTELRFVDSIIAQMRHMENTTSRRSAACAVIALMFHHPDEVIERLLSQPLPLDRSCEECWKAVDTNDQLGSRALELLLLRLENNTLFNENTTITHPDENRTAYLPSLATIVALRHLLQIPNAEVLIIQQLPGLLSALLKYLAGWLHVDTPASVVNTKFGYVPNKEACKINPHAEVYNVLTNVLTLLDFNAASSLLNETISASEFEAEESVVSTVRMTMRCISNKHEVLMSMVKLLGPLMSSTISMQRAIAVIVYGEVIGKIDCGAVWLDIIINTLHEAKSDFSPMVRKLATIALARIAYLEPKQINEYFENCMDALLSGLEEPPNGQGGNDVILESLRGLSTLMSVEFERPIAPSVVFALKPFIEKENWEMRLAAITALGAVASSWQRSVTSPDDDITDHLLGCLCCLFIRLEDPNETVIQTTQETLCMIASLLPSATLHHVMTTHLGPQVKFDFENFLYNLKECLQKEFPQKIDELRNNVCRGYSKSESYGTRATSALILGVFGPPRPDDVQRLLQLLRDKEPAVRIRAARALSLSFTS